jgi:hypothetical protein
MVLDYDNSWVILKLLRTRFYKVMVWYPRLKLYVNLQKMQVAKLYIKQGDFNIVSTSSISYLFIT